MEDTTFKKLQPPVLRQPIKQVKRARALRKEMSFEILPGTGRCPVRAEGSHFEVCSAAEMWNPSVASRHLPVSGRILG